MSYEIYPLNYSKFLQGEVVIAISLISKIKFMILPALELWSSILYPQSEDRDVELNIAAPFTFLIW